MKVSDIEQSNGLVVICGGPGAGKTTLSKHLRDAHGYHRLERRAYAQEFVVPEFLKENPDCPLKGRDLVSEATFWLRKYGGLELSFLNHELPPEYTTCVIDGLRSLEEVRTFEQRCSVEPTFIGLYADNEMRLKRILARDDLLLYESIPEGVTPEEHVRNMLATQEKKFQHPQMIDYVRDKGHFVVDTTYTRPQDVLVAIERKLGLVAGEELGWL